MKKILLLLMILTTLPFVSAFTVEYGNDTTDVYTNTYNFSIKGQGIYCKALFPLFHPTYIEVNETRNITTWEYDEELNTTREVSEEVYGIYQDENPCTYEIYKQWADKEINDTIEGGIVDENPVYEMIGTLQTDTIVATNIVQTDSIVANNIITNTTKDVNSVSKITNLLDNLPQESEWITPEGKLSEYVLFDFEHSSLGSYRLDAIGHYNRLWIVKLSQYIYNTLIPKVNENDRRLDLIENNGWSGTCPSGNLVVNNGIVVGCQQ